MKIKIVFVDFWSKEAIDRRQLEAFTKACKEKRIETSSALRCMRLSDNQFTETFKQELSLGRWD